MEEEECDYHTPIGKIMKQMNALSKKPKLDEELGLALDVFHKKMSKQQVYLKNGIFNINFAEAALFLQSCADLYGKKVDLLWDQLLEFHTRLIEYDCEHEKEKGKAMNSEIIQQLEERRNRYKRKKKFKLVLSCDDNIDSFIFDKSLPAIGNTFECDDEVLKKWKKLELKSAQITSIPNAIYKQQLRMYRMKNYYIMKHQDFDVYDTEDGEFNIKYGRIPGWHFIQHLFEYNKKGLLPDKNNLIATLRLGSYLRLAFMRDNKIPLNAEYPVYRLEYAAFKKKFFENESKKWQNMPLDTMEDLHKQLQYLAEKEHEQLRQKNTQSNCISPSPNNNLSGVIHCYNDSSNNSHDIEKLIEESDNDSLFELSFSCDDLSKSDLCIRLERLSTNVIDTKLRQDSGFFDRASDCEDDLDRDSEFSGDGNNNQIQKDTSKNSEANISSTGTPNDDATMIESCDVCPDHAVRLDDSMTYSENTNNPSTSLVTTENLADLPAVTISNVVTPPQSHYSSEYSNENCGRNISQENVIADHNKENINPNSDDVDDFDTRSVISDHSYSRISIPRKNVLEENDNILRKRHLNAKKYVSSAFVSSLTMIIPRAIRTKIPKEQNVIKQDSKWQENDPSPTKRRKMSTKQLEKLVDKMVVLPTVKENKFEHFFSKNYQPQLGEGEIQEMDYESESDAEDNFVEPLPVENPPPSTDVLANNISLQDDNISIFSDHNYSQPAENHLVEPPPGGILPVTDPLQETDSQSIFSDHNYSGHPADDSGFLDSTLNQSRIEGDHLDDFCIEETERNDAIVAEVVTEGSLDPREEEYQRLLKALKDSRRTVDEEMEATPEEMKTEHHRREQEIRESRARVVQWKDTINPILRNLHESDFNIHEYGSNIMDGMEVNQSRPFASIVDGKSSAEVVRFFIASLQLANTYNIEICGVKRGELSNDSFNVKLLKRDRYHEHLTEYQAPSEETFRERVKRVRTMREGGENNSDVPDTKKQRLPATPKRTNYPRSFSKTSNTPHQRRSVVPDTSWSVDDLIRPIMEPQTEERDTKVGANSFQPNTVKGKSIMKIVVPRMDLAAPSTSRHLHWPDSSDFSCDPNFSVTEESFLEDLISEQLQNPHIQISSSPKGALA